MRKHMKLVSMVLLVAMCVFCLAGCGGNKQQQEAAPAAGEAKLSDTLVFAQGAEPRGLDPALVDDGESAKVMANIYEGLVKYAPDSTDILPCLAKSWEISEDGLTYTFKLQEDVLFHDGTPFNAEAVKFNIDRQLPPLVTEDMGYAGFVFGSVDNVEVVDEYTVKINLKSPSTPFMANLAMALGAPIVSPTALQNNDNNVNQAPCGTGPYKFVSWSPSENVVLERNENYWGTPAKTQNIIFRFIADNSARVVALTNGEVDMIDGIDATVVDQIKAGQMTVDNIEGMTINYLAYNTQSPVVADKEVRKALSQAVNVPELVASLYQGYASEATTILPSFMPGYSAEVKQVGYDPEAAKAVLEAKGITEIHVITYTNPRPYNTANGQTLAEAIQGYWSKVGVTAKIDAYDWSTYKEKVKTGDYDVCFYGWNGDNGDPDNFMNLLCDPDPTMNVARYNNPEFNALIAQGVATANGEERNALYAQMEKIVAEDCVWLPISHAQVLSAYNPLVDGYYYHKTAVVFFSEMSKPAK